MNENERSFAPAVDGTSADMLGEKLSECKKRIEELHCEIGKVYCLVAGDAPLPELDALVKEVRLNEKLAAEYTERIDALERATPCPVCGKPVAGDALFCTFCGASLKAEEPVEEAPVEPAAEEAAPAPEAAPEEPAGRACPVCGAPAVGDMPFCTSCGHRIDEAPVTAEPEPEPVSEEPAGRVCPVCGKPAVGDLPFCTSCGSRIDGEPAPVEPEPAPAPEPEPEPVPEEPKGRTCPVCGAPVEEGSLFCTSCGAKLDGEPAPAVPAKRFCTVCGNEVPEGNLFCTVCGNKM